MTETLQSKYIRALKACNQTEVKRTSKYVVYTRADGGFYYIGRSGALRFGTTSAGSIPVSKKMKKLLLASIVQ